MMYMYSISEFSLSGVDQMDESLNSAKVCLILSYPDNLSVGHIN